MSTTHRPATDLGYLLAKNPARTHTFDLSTGRATVFFPEATDERCTAVLHVEVDTTAAARAGRADEDAPLARYVNDRSYAASSLLSVAMTRALGTAMAGRSRERPELARTPIPLEATIVALPCRGGEAVVRRLFAPLGWEVAVAPVAFPDGFAPVVPTFDVTLRGTGLLADLLTHVYVLVPVLDDQKHYWIGDDEVDKLLANGGAWLASHPDRELVIQRYLGHHRALIRDATARLTEGEEPPADDAVSAAAEDGLEAPLSLVDQRYEAVLRRLRASGARSVADVGCGEGKLLRRLAKEPGLRRVVGLDVSTTALERARRRVDPDTLGAKAAARVELLHGSILYRDERLDDVDALLLVEVIEHLDPDRLAALEDVVFAATRPRTVLVTTPNAEYNARFPGLPAGRFRHRDHRFEWTRAELRAWAEGVAARHGYTARFEDVGPIDEALGAPTQLVELSR